MGTSVPGPRVDLTGTAPNVSGGVRPGCGGTTISFWDSVARGDGDVTALAASRRIGDQREFLRIIATPRRNANPTRTWLLYTALAVPTRRPAKVATETWLSSWSRNFRRDRRPACRRRLRLALAGRASMRCQSPVGRACIRSWGWRSSSGRLDTTSTVRPTSDLVVHRAPRPAQQRGFHLTSRQREPIPARRYRDVLYHRMDGRA